MSTKPKFVVHPLPSSFGGDRFPAHKPDDTSCPTCTRITDLERQLEVVREQWRQWQPTSGGPTWWTPEFEAVKDGRSERMTRVGACGYCGELIGFGASHASDCWREEERKEPEVSNYTKSAEIAGKLLKHMEEAGCKLPSATLYTDGSGYFTAYLKDEVVARKVFGSYLPDVILYRRSMSDEDDVNFDFKTGSLEKYTSVCHACKRPLEEENE